MPLHTHNNYSLSGLKKLSIAITLAFALPAAVQAAALGKLTVLSALGQPLRAEIALSSVSKDEEGALVAKLASAEAFKKANIDFNPLLSSLQFSVEQRQGRQFVRITSSQAINEPFVDLLLELNGGGGKQVREYTFLLDPADMRRPQTAQSSRVVNPGAAKAAANNAGETAKQASSNASAKTAAAGAAATAAAAATAPASGMANASDEEPVSTIVTKAEPSSLAEELIKNGRSEQSNLTNAPVPAAVAEKTVPRAPAETAPAEDMRGNSKAAAASSEAKGAGEKNGKSYRVKEGDTLADIAARNKSNAVSLDQMLVALYRTNPDAFMGQNMNRLRAGRVLTVPDADAAAAMAKPEARATVVAQARDFNAYRNKLAGQVANGPAKEMVPAKRSGSGKVSTRIEEKSAASEPRDKLQLSKTSAKERAAADKAAAEEKIASDKALAEATDRVKQLEKNVSDLQRLLEIKNKTLAELGEQKKAETPVVEKAVEKAAEKAEEKPAEKTAATPAAPTESEVPKADTPPAQPAPAMAEKPAEKPKAPVVPTQPALVEKPGFFDHILSNPFVLPGAGLLVALLAGLGGYGVMRMRSKKKASEASPADADKEGESKPKAASKVAEPVAAPETVPVAEMAAATAVAAVAAVEEAPAPAPEPVVEAEVAAPAPAPAPAEPSKIDDEVDAIAEADMYITYGRDEQAEDILRLALKSEPDRQAIRVKLLEIYAKREDVNSFNDVAEEIHAATGGAGEEWQQAVAMGIVLDPTNPLYGAVIETVEEQAPEAVTPEPAATSEETDLEFDLDDFKAAELQANDKPAADIGEKIDFDLELDSGAAGKEVAEPVAENTIELDLPAPVEAPKPQMLEDDESAFASEMSTKLDLAAAYQEIGDREGARELLEEVIRGGNDGQIVRAKEMLAAL